MVSYCRRGRWQLPTIGSKNKTVTYRRRLSFEALIPFSFLGCLAQPFLRIGMLQVLNEVCGVIFQLDTFVLHLRTTAAHRRWCRGCVDI